MLRTAIIAALIALPAVASAHVQETGDKQAESGQPPQRVRSVSVTGTQACPKSTDTDIVVCNRITEPYRIPKALRDDKPIAAQNQSWVNRAATADQIGRVAGGLPDTCSPVGTGGQSGCSLQQNKAYAAERRARANGDPDFQ